VRSPDDLAPELAGVIAQSPQALHLFADPVLHGRRGEITAFAAKHRLPIVCDASDVTDAGGLMSYGVYLPDLFPPRGALRRPDSEGQAPFGAAGRAAHAIRAGDQPQDRAQPWPRDFAVDPGARGPGDRMTPRSSLLRKYVIVFLALVIARCSRTAWSKSTLPTRNTKRRCFRLQQEKALAAASRIEQFIRDVEARARASRPFAVEQPGHGHNAARFEYRRIARQGARRSRRSAGLEPSRPGADPGLPPDDGLRWTAEPINHAMPKFVQDAQGADLVQSGVTSGWRIGSRT
jgi:hypothetical protein